MGRWTTDKETHQYKTKSVVEGGLLSEGVVGRPIVDCAVKEGSSEEESFELKLGQSKDPNGSIAGGRTFLWQRNSILKPQVGNRTVYSRN